MQFIPCRCWTAGCHRNLARLYRTGEPPVTIDRARMARKRMFFTSTRAERELGYRFRPVEETLPEAIACFRESGYLR